MYSVLVTPQAADQSHGAFDISRSRFLEHTSESISSQLKPLSVEARDCIKSWPCILMQEGRGDENAYIVQIKYVEIAEGEIKLTIATLPEDSAILLNDDLWKMRAELQIDQFEFNRCHWAIKDRDLFAILAAGGHAFDTTTITRFENKPLPAPRRGALLGAIDVISNWSHSQIDRFLLETEVSDLAAGRDIGSRQERAQAIVKFAIAHPSATTAENSLFSYAIAMQTKLPVDERQTTDLSPIERNEVGQPKRPQERETSAVAPSRVFVVHGQNEATRSAVVAFLTAVGLQAIVLHEQANMGRHLLTKFIEEAKLVTFAVVVMTDDDIGSLKGEKLASRARQNVILELGYFLSYLGQSRVCALISPGLQTPSDFDGIAYISMDEGGQWKIKLMRELRAARMPVADIRPL